MMQIVIVHACNRISTIKSRIYSLTVLSMTLIAAYKLYQSENTTHNACNRSSIFEILYTIPSQAGGQSTEML